MGVMSTVAIPAAETLSLWERAGGAGPVGRALALAAYDGTDPDVVVAEPVGRCHARILRWRLATLGTDMTATAACPICAARVEFALDAERLLRLATEPGDSNPPPVPPPVVAWRPPTVGDLAAAGSEPDPATALLRACVTVSEDVGDPVALPDEVLAEVEAAMMAADPLAELLVSLQCPDCGTPFESVVDLGEFVWAELDARATRLLHEVDILAHAYGWTEPQVLALSEQRRAAYLRLVLDGVP
jgi:hypothetical protein